MATVYEMTPAEVITFNLDWSQFIGSAVIVTSIWSCDLPGPNLSVSAIGAPNTSTSIEVSSVPSGSFYSPTNTITTSDGQTMQASFQINGVANNYV